MRIETTINDNSLKDIMLLCFMKVFLSKFTKSKYANCKK